MNYKTRILKVHAPEYGTVIAELSDGFRYYAFLPEDFALDPRLPRTQKLWNAVGVDATGQCLCWPNGFRVHVEHVVALAFRVEPRELRARRAPGALAAGF